MQKEKVSTVIRRRYIDDESSELRQNINTKKYQEHFKPCLPGNEIDRSTVEKEEKCV